MIKEVGNQKLNCLLSVAYGLLFHLDEMEMLELLV